MKRIISAIFLLIVVALLLHSCKKGPCDNVTNYEKLYTPIVNLLYKAGSFWVYRDSVSGQTDSFYVYNYSYRKHIQGADIILGLGNGVPGSGTNCGPSYHDSLVMHVQRYQDGILMDTLTFYGTGTAAGNAGVEICGHDTISKGAASSTVYFIDWPDTGFVKCCYSLTSGGTSADTSGSWYYGIKNSIISGTYVFNNVYVEKVKIGDGTCPWFAHWTHVYVSSGNGIIKMVQHLPAKDVRWDLINYRIVK